MRIDSLNYGCYVLIDIVKKEKHLNSFPIEYNKVLDGLYPTSVAKHVPSITTFPFGDVKGLQTCLEEKETHTY